VRTPALRRAIAIQSAERAPILIAVGLAMIVAAAWVPAMPVVTAMAILALGATDATLSRFRNTPAIVPILLMHAATYVGLYGLFIGATLHAAATASPGGLGIAAALDLAANSLPMAITLQRILSGLRQDLEPKG
jgi:hypothetical protein